MNSICAAVILTSVLATAGFCDSAAEVPNRTGPDVRGVITQAQSGEGDVRATITVEGAKDADTVYDRASVRVTRATKIASAVGFEGREPFDLLAIGARIEVHLTGPVAESYPVQGTASEILVIEAAGVVPVEAPKFEGTTGVVEKAAAGDSQAVLRGVRAARNDGYDRIVFEFEGDRLPGYRIEYLAGDAIQCGSGEPVRVAGGARLAIRLQPAVAHTEEGRPTVTEREMRPNLASVKELKSTCDFEAEVSWVAGVSSKKAYRVLELRAPTRLVVDVEQ